MPREEKFFALFNDHARTLVDGAVALRDLLEGGTGVAEACRRIVAHENEADAIAREVLLAVRRTFITPFDRGDIKDLISQLDDAIDQMQKTAKAITLFEVIELRAADAPDGRHHPALRRTDGGGGGPAGRHARERQARINAIAEEITRLEEQADELNDAGIKALYLKHKGGDAMGFIVGNEIYDHLEKVVDRFEDVANRISGILIEQV